MRILETLFSNADDVALLNLKRWNINLASIDIDMSVIHKLACLTAGGRETRPVNGIIKPAFKQEKQIFTGNSLLARGLFEVIAKLLLKHEVNTLDFLFFPKLQTVSGQRLAPAPSSFPYLAIALYSPMDGKAKS